MNAANALLAKTVSTSGSLEEETARLDSAPPEALTELSTAELKRLLRNGDWQYAHAEAEAETLEETIERHLDALLEYAETKDAGLLPRAEFAKREILRLRAIHDRLEVVVNADLTLLPSDRPPYDGQRPRLIPDG